MLKNITTLSNKISEVEEHIFHCLPSSSIPSIKDSLNKFMAFIVNIEEKAKEIAANPEPVPEIPEPVVRHKMSVYILPQQMLPAPELIAAMNGSNVAIGTLLQTPVKLILDNQSTTSVVLSISLDSGESFIQWKTFSAGEAIILDDDIYTFPKGCIFRGNGAANGSFSISYTYINYPGISTVFN